MTMSTSKDHVVVPGPGYHNVLAINRNQEYQVLSSSEPSLYFKLGLLHYCQGQQILKTNFRKTCLGALYVKEAQAASRYCDFQVQRAYKRVFCMKDNNYMIYTKKELVATKICGPSQEHIQIS